MHIHKNNQRKADANRNKGKSQSITPKPLKLVATPDPKAPQETEEEKLAKQKKSRFKPEEHGWNMKAVEPKQYKPWNYNKYLQNQQAAIRRKDLEEENAKEQSISTNSSKVQNEQISNTLDLDAYKGQKIEKQGCISSPAKDFELVQSIGVRIRQKPSSDGEELGRLKYNTSILIRALDNTGQ